MDQAPNEITCQEQGRAGLVRLTRVKELNALTLGMIQALEAFKHRLREKSAHIRYRSGGGRKGVLRRRRHPAHPEPGPGPAGGGGPILCRGISAQLDAAVFSQAARVVDERRHDGRRRRHQSLRHPPGGGRELQLRHARDRHRLHPRRGRVLVSAAHAGKDRPLSRSYGPRFRRADTYYLGVATHCIPDEKFEAIKAAMIEAQPIDPILDALHEPPGESELERLSSPVDRIFSAATLDDVLKGLEREDGEWRDWAQETLSRLSKRSPLSLKVTFELQRRGSAFDP